MATLTEDELARIRAEVYDNVLDAGATVYFPVRSLYDVISGRAASAVSVAVAAVKRREVP